MLRLLLLILNIQSVISYSVFGGNAYGYTGGSKCAALNGCISQTMEHKDGSIWRLYGSAGGKQLHNCIDDNYDRDIEPSLMDVHEDAFDFYILAFKKDWETCQTGNTTVYCQTWNRINKDLRTTIDEILKYQVLYDLSVQNSYQGGGVWKWNTTFSAAKLWKGIEKKKCKEGCFQDLLKACLTTMSVRHVRDWCITMHSWLDRSNLSQYQHGLLWMVYRIISNIDQYVEHKVVTEEKAVLVSAALSTVFLTKNWFSSLSRRYLVSKKGIYNLGTLGHVSMHSLFLANYAGRLRVTLQTALGKGSLGTLGISVQTTLRGFETARNYEGLTGTVYAAIAALFNNPKFAGNVRFRLEIGEVNGIGCVEQTTGMIFVRPGDWVAEKTKWVPIGTKKYRPSGLIAVDEKSNTSTLEISGGGLVLYPVTISSALADIKNLKCNAVDGNGPAEHGNMDLQGLGGICNWVPTWGPVDDGEKKPVMKSLAMEPEVLEQEESEEEMEEEDIKNDDEQRSNKNPINAKRQYKPFSRELTVPEPKKRLMRGAGFRGFVNNANKLLVARGIVNARSGKKERSNNEKNRDLRIRKKKSWDRVRSKTRNLPQHDTTHSRRTSNRARTTSVQSTKADRSSRASSFSQYIFIAPLAQQEDLDPEEL